jgi:hypothetical protein
MIQLLGNALGQNGSTLNVGPSASAGPALKAVKSARAIAVRRVKNGMIGVLPNAVPCMWTDGHGFSA